MSDEREYRDHALSRVYREGAWPEPGRQIDRAILSASRRAARARHPVLWRWAPSLAVAATVVLTSTLVLKVYREQPEVAAPVTPEKIEKTETRAKQPAPEPTAEAKPATGPAQLPPVTTPRGFTSTMDAGEAERLERAQRDIGFKDVTSPVGAQVPAKAAPAPKAQPALKKEEPARADAQTSPSAGAPVSVFGAAPPAAQRAPQPASQPTVRFGKPATQGTTAATQPRTEAAQEMPQVQAPPPPEAMRPAPAANNMLSRSTMSGASLDTASAKTAERSPQSWIEDIRKLMKEGKSEEAGAQIAELKKRYPDYALPEDLR
jgi:hypothetical protein